MKRGNVGEAYDGKKPRIVTDMYESNMVTGKNTPSMQHPIERTKLRAPANQYGENRIIAGGKGKK